MIAQGGDELHGELVSPLWVHVVGTVDVHHVRVRSEAQFATAEAPHRDDREIERLVLRGDDDAPHGAQRGLDGDLGDGGERVGHLLDRDGPDDRSDRHSQQLPPAEHPDRPHRILDGGVTGLDGSGLFLE
jgi:hypothetical protein